MPKPVPTAHALRLLAERGLEQAEALQKRMLKASNAEVLDLMGEFERVTGEVRKAIALEASLARARRHARPAPPPRIPDPDSGTVH